MKVQKKDLTLGAENLDVSKIKADNIITAALVDNSYTTEQRATLKSKIKDNISIAGVVPNNIMNKILIIREIATKNPLQLNELNSLSYTSTSYVVTLKGDSKLGLDSKQCIDILNSIIHNYIQNFKNTYGLGEVLGTLIAEDVDFASYDYVELYDVYNTQVDDALRYLDIMIKDAKYFRSTTNKMTFQDMKTRVLSIKNYNIKALETYIFEFGIANEESIINVQTYIQEKLDNIDIEIEASEKLLNDTSNAMTNIFQPYYNTKTDVNGNEEKYLANGEIYQQYSENLIKYQTQLVLQRTTKTLWTNRLAKFNSAAQLTESERNKLITKADSMLEKINSDINKEIAFINEAVDEYIEVDLMKNSIMMTVAASKVKEDTFNIKMLILVEVLAIFLAALLAIYVTAKKEKKAVLAASERVENTAMLNKSKSSSSKALNDWREINRKNE